MEKKPTPELMRQAALLMETKHTTKPAQRGEECSGSSAWLGAVVEFRVVLWSRLCLSQPARNKVTKHDTLEAAIAFVDGIESGLKKDLINGELNFWDADDLLASICVRVAPNVPDQRPGEQPKT